MMLRIGDRVQCSNSGATGTLRALHSHGVADVVWEPGSTGTGVWGGEWRPRPLPPSRVPVGSLRVLPGGGQSWEQRAAESR